MDKLKPCPFCGGEATLLVGAMGAYAICTECFIQTEPEMDNKEKRGALIFTIEKWNRRTP